MERLDLERPRDAAAIISAAFRVWWSHLAVFVTLAALPVIPVSFLIDGLWVGKLGDVDTNGPWEAVVVSTVLWSFLVTPLVTAMHVLVVLGLGRGDEPAVGPALRDGLRVLPRVIVAVILYAAAVLGGFVLLIVPGIWLSVSCFFAAQASVVDDARGLGALRRSREIVRGSWWRTLGIVILLSLVASLLAVPLGFVTQIIGAVADNGPLYVLGSAIAQTVTLSFTALAGTLLYFDLRLRSEGAPAPGGHEPLISPERPAPEPA